MSAIRDNWRVGALVILLVASSLALFVPGVGLGEAAADGPTNLQYGLDLSGGTRIQAPLVGWTAEGVDVTQDNRDQLRAAVAENLDGATQSDVAVRFDGETPLSSGGTIEVFRDVSRSEFEAALEAAGVDNSGVREGVTQPTRDTTVDVIQRKIDASGLAGGTVQTSSTPGGEYFVVVEVPNQNSSQVRSLVETRGVVEMVARFPGEGGVRNETVLTQNDITQVSPVQEPNRQIPAPHVPISLTEDGAQRFATSMRENGFTTQQGVSACSGTPPAQQYCLVTVLDGEPVYEASMGPDLARSIESGDFVRDQSFVITATNRSDAAALRINLQAGALPTSLDLEAGISNFIAPALAENFKLYSLVTGIVAVLAVVVVVFFRYGDPKVAAPMVVTALSEVAILLGFAAAVGLALDLSHIAGLIAVIGTGVDDLIIIADEVMAEGDVSSGRVFRSRFRKAFWVIGAAALTTIIAMSPLAILQLGDLRGFAIITILGVIVGVLITRPAYGDILRALLTGR
ncbi:MAG TPA: preprotein translocase subunit SecD [Halobacteriales archaeon]|nr:preprotein translocase subunit SecD [Halobacteriales archaeon]